MAGRGRPRKVQNQDETMVITNVIQNETNEIVVTPETKDITTFELSAKITAGELTSNAKELETIVKNELQNYTVEKYIGDPSAAAKDKAILNKLSDGIAAKRKEITTAWNKPLDEFLDTMKGLEKSIKEANSKLKTITDEAENQEKEIKKQKIADYFKTLDFAIVPFERIFNPKWLNKTYEMKNIMLDIEAITEKISGEMATIRSMQDEDSEILQSFYLDTLDLNATLQKGNQLKANREKIKAQEEAEKNKTPERKEIDQANEQWRNQKLQNPGVINNSVPEQKKAAVNNMVNNLMSFTLKLYGTKEQLIALRKYIDENNIKYEKL